MSALDRLGCKVKILNPLYGDSANYIHTMLGITRANPRLN